MGGWRDGGMEGGRRRVLYILFKESSQLKKSIKACTVGPRPLFCCRVRGGGEREGKVGERGRTWGTRFCSVSIAARMFVSYIEIYW